MRNNVKSNAEKRLSQMRKHAFKEEKRESQMRNNANKGENTPKSNAK